ncbi:MAG: germination protein YpeB [Christensenellaceae bacterium]|nr:germination protein YpeB [Christensenellaceae bacterium]
MCGARNGIRIVVLILIALLVATLATVLGISVMHEKQYKLEIDNLYKKSYYDALDSVSSLELKLSKLMVTESTAMQRKLMRDIWLDAEVATANLSQLVTKSEQINKIVRFLNKLGDYCKSLCEKRETEKISKSERVTLDELHTLVTGLKKAMANSSDSIMTGSSFVTRLGDGIAILSDAYGRFNNDESIVYPEMIYDGPFSDGLADRKVKFLEGKNEINMETAKDIIDKKLTDVSHLEFITECKGSVEGFMFFVTWADGYGAITLSKNGGFVIDYIGYKSVVVPNLNEEECVAKARAILERLGYFDMMPVWVTNSHSMVYINFAFTKNNVTYYPDLIKVKVSTDTGSIIGLDALNYIYNHIGERAIPANTTIAQDARAKVSANIKIDSQRLCVIPTEWNSEIVAYEFSGKYKDNLYFVYIDAVTFEEIKIMKVVEQDGGVLVA